MSRVDIMTGPILLPMPVLIIGTYDANGIPNAMSVAWGMISDVDEITLSLAHHKTTENIELTGAFTVSFATETTMVPCDYVGIVSATDVADKFSRAHFTETKSEYVNAPIINELPVALECKVKSFADGILVGTIVNISADDEVLTDEKIDIKKLKPIVYDPVRNRYLSLGDVIGDAFKDGNKLIN